MLPSGASIDSDSDSDIDIDSDTTAPSVPPSFAGAELPEPDSQRRKFAVRCVALLAIAVSVVYLSWRVLFTLDMGAWYLSVPLVLLEAHAVVGLALFTFSLWDVDAVAPAPERQRTDARVAVLIPTFNEPSEVLLPTVAAAVALQPHHETWVLDDGDRPEVRALADRLGARYLARTDRSHAKAGNINNALTVIDADLMAVLDADHVAAPGFLTHTLGYFDDPKIAVVQTPQDFYNLDSFEHDANHNWADRRRRKARFNEQALFYRAIEPGKNRWDAAFWCGTGALVRVAALREVGGVATETVTEDIHTTIRLHRKGWRSVYHNEVLARGLAASDAGQYLAQRLRWGIGAMQVLRTENPLTVSGLRLRQRIAYGATLLGWFDAWRSLGYLVLPPAVLFSGAVPIRSRPLVFGVAFGVTFLIQRVALALLGRGFAPQGISTVFELVRMSPNLRATLTLFRPGGRAFTVTPKGRVGDERTRTQVPRLLSAALVVSLVAAVWFALSAAGRTPLSYDEPWAAYGAAFWLGVNALFVLAAIRRIRSERFAGERRASVRFDVSMPGRLDGGACRIHDISLTGAKVAVPAERSGSLRSSDGDGHHRARVAIPFGDVVLDLAAAVRSVRPAGEADVVVGLEFEPGQDSTRARLALALFNAQLVPELEPARVVAPEDAPAAVGAFVAPAVLVAQPAAVSVAEPAAVSVAQPAALVPSAVPVVPHCDAAPLVPSAVPAAWVEAVATEPWGPLVPVRTERSAFDPADHHEPVSVHAALADAGSGALATPPWRRSADDVLPAVRGRPSPGSPAERSRHPRAWISELGRALRDGAGRR
ncbi:MAG: glycosyltransferase [Acidimicrobiales bacterium]